MPYTPGYRPGSDAALAGELVRLIELVHQGVGGDQLYAEAEAFIRSLRGRRSRPRPNYDADDDVGDVLSHARRF